MLGIILELQSIG